MRDKALDAHFTAKWVAQCARGERFKPANEYVESIPTLTDSMSGGVDGHAGLVAEYPDHMDERRCLRPPNLCTGGRSAHTYIRPVSAGVEPCPLTFNADAPTREDGAATPLAVTSSAPIPERDILKAVLAVCEAHPRVAWAQRMNTGAFKVGQRYVRFGFKGCSDVIGQLRDGRFLAIETKRAGKDGTKEQMEFLGKVSRAGGLAFVAWSAADAVRGLDELEAA